MIFVDNIALNESAYSRKVIDITTLLIILTTYTHVDLKTTQKLKIKICRKFRLLTWKSFIVSSLIQ